jgi:hypothetical protein
LGEAALPLIILVPSLVVAIQRAPARRRMKLGGGAVQFDVVVVVVELLLL